PDPLEEDHRDLAGGPRLVLVVGRPDRGHRLPQRRALRRGGGAGAGLEALGQHLHVDLGLCAQVLVPRRMGRRAPPGGHDHVALAVPPVDERRGAGLTGAAAGGGQQQRRHPFPDVAVLAAGGEIAPGVLLLPAGWPASRWAWRGHGSNLPRQSATWWLRSPVGPLLCSTAGEPA